MPSQFIRLPAFLAILAAPWSALADSVKPFHYGPFVMNQVSMIASPRGYDYVLSNGYYHFQIGWIEPIWMGSGGLFQKTYFEAEANVNLSPYYVDLGTTFNLKPIRYLEVGLSYTRLLYNNSMATFTESDREGRLPPADAWGPSAIMAVDKEPGGADIFTFQANLTFDIGRLQLYLFGSRSQWDVDAEGRDFVYEYIDDLLIEPRDRVNYALGQINLDLRPLAISNWASFTGLAMRGQYWYSDRTRLEKAMASGGFTGFRIGKDTENQKRGLDMSLGYVFRHPQIPPGASEWDRLVILADWKWNIRVLNL